MVRLSFFILRMVLFVCIDLMESCVVCLVFGGGVVLVVLVCWMCVFCLLVCVFGCCCSYLSLVCRKFCWFDLVCVLSVRCLVFCLRYFL